MTVRPIMTGASRSRGDETASLSRSLSRQGAATVICLLLRSKQREGSAVLLCTLAAAVLSLASVAILRSGLHGRQRVSGARSVVQSRLAADAFIERARAIVDADLTRLQVDPDFAVSAPRLGLSTAYIDRLSVDSTLLTRPSVLRRRVSDPTFANAAGFPNAHAKVIVDETGVVDIRVFLHGAPTDGLPDVADRQTHSIDPVRLQSEAGLPLSISP